VKDSGVESSAPDCPFCRRLADGDVLAEIDLAAAIHDAYPVSPGHALILPRRHEADYFALSAEERRAMWALAEEVCRHLEDRHRPDGYNIGVNAGEAAGQTVAHAHLHVIPRHQGDVADPRGGIRQVIPERAAYWEDGDECDEGRGGGG
jgi:diadenosine tetraphosphate (Ap4A) HIT family hydrolase